MSTSPGLISSRSNPKVKQLRAAFSGNQRLSGGLVAIEGDHLISEALRSGISFHTLFVTPSYPLPKNLPHQTEIVRLSEDVFSGAADTRSPQGIAALIEPLSRSLDEMLAGRNPLLVAAVGLQDPGNLGTLIRSAEAFGATGLLTTPGTVSEWNQKALRASVGSIFRFPVAASTIAEIATLRPRGLRIYAAVGSSGTSAPLEAHQTGLHQPCVILIGSEGSGLSPEWMDIATAGITVRCPGSVESLNAAVAGSILLYEASRQRAENGHHTTARAERIPNTQPRRPTGATR